MSYFFESDHLFGKRQDEIERLLGTAGSIRMSLDIHSAAIELAKEFKKILEDCNNLNNADLQHIAQSIMSPDFSDAYVPRGALIELLVAKGLNIEDCPGDIETTPEGRILIGEVNPQGIRIGSNEERILNDLKHDLQVMRAAVVAP